MTIRHLPFLLLFMCLASVSHASIRESIVHIYTDSSRYDFHRPWLKHNERSSTGSGCIIEGKQILTNAHVVSDPILIRVRRAGQADKFTAKVKWVSHELDLAILTVEDETFFADAVPLEFGEFPSIGEKIITLGFPKGGTRITITEGVLSRVDLSNYSHSGYSNLVAQIDAAINPGVSGGPAVDEAGKIVGVCFQGRSEGNNIGYIIPVLVVKHFFADIADGVLDGVPALPAFYQNMENEQIRDYYKMDKDLRGVLIRAVSPPEYEGEDKFLPDDVLLELNGKEVGNDGTVNFRTGERLDISILTNQMQMGDLLTAKVWRDGEVVEVSFPLLYDKGYRQLVQRTSYEKAPRYYVAGGFVFTPLSANLLSIRKWSNVSVYIKKYWYEMRDRENNKYKEVITIGNNLTDELNVGMRFSEMIVDKINDIEIYSMEDVIDAVENHTGDYLTIELLPSHFKVIVSKEKLLERNEAILENYGITHDRSIHFRE